MFTKILLALTGQYKWPEISPLPIEFILLPLNFPINFYSLSVFGRANITPIMILFDQKFSIRTNDTPTIADLNLQRHMGQSWGNSPHNHSINTQLHAAMNYLQSLPGDTHRLAIERARDYMLTHIEPDGTLYSYYSCTYLMIFALLALGYRKNDPVIVNAVNGIKSMKCEINGKPHMQYTTATIWNTSLIGYALQEARVSPDEPMIQRANQYLLVRQQYKYGDWAIHVPNTLPGGWGFSNVNTILPDVDDTTSTLRSISRIALNERQAWDRGINWVMSMQNDDGGWPAFERNVNSELVQLLPIEKSEFFLLDPSCADLTGRTLEFLGNFTNLSRNHDDVKKGVRWIIKSQEKDGSWYGRWGICYIYGTWAAITGMHAVGVPASHSSLQKAVKWLGNIQNQDGGWGESCKSDIKKAYVPLGASTITHTAWALDALIAVSDQPTPEIYNGITYLLTALEKEDWTTDYPKGQGMAGAFYIHYHSYRYIFPLLALAHYQKKYTST